jgi:hypothetical protein
MDKDSQVFGAAVAGAAAKGSREIGLLYHLAEMENLSSIVKHGLMSTKRLLDLAQVSNPRRPGLLRGHRQDPVQLADGIVIRDQRPMPPSALSQALDPGLSPADWYALLNGFVFLWPDRGRLERHLRACKGRPQALLTFDSGKLLNHFASDAFVSPINTGNARRKPALRGRETFVPYNTWLEHGWPNGPRNRPPAEVVFRGVLPVKEPYLINIARI